MICESFMWRLKVEGSLSPSLSDDIGEVYPISRIVQEVKDKQDYGTALSQETYYQVSLIPRPSPSFPSLPVTCHAANNES